MTEATKKRKTFVHRDFAGVDYAHSKDNISPRRSVNGLNMVRSEVGKVRKRTGYDYEEKQWDERINGVHFYVKGNVKTRIIHCGTKLYAGEECLFTDAADNYSRSIQAGDNLIIADGKNLLFYNGEKIEHIKDNAYVPTVYINRKPEGGGEKLEQGNILTRTKIEGFISDGESTVYNLSRAALDDELVTVNVFNDDGSRKVYSTGDGITVDSEAGTITFEKPPEATKYTDKSNVFIIYEKYTGRYKKALEKCTVLGLYGQGGRPDTLFLSGNPEHPGREWFSAAGNIFFIGEENTDCPGMAEVKGYSTRGGKLFVHRKNAGENMNILVRQCNGNTAESFSYPVVNMLTGPSAIAENSFVNMSNDALFLTEKGVYAVAESEADERHFVQRRSYFINPALMKKEGLERAWAVEYEDFYVLAAGRDIYLLDTLQKSYEEDKEYARWQYECYHWQIADSIRLMFVENNRLCFATEEGRIGRFHSDYSAEESYNDAGVAIHAIWQTGCFDYGEATRNKNVYRLWVVTGCGVKTGVKVRAETRGKWKRLYEDDCRKCDGECDIRLISRNVLLKNTDRVAVRLENDRLNEALEISEIGYDYTTGGYYR